MFRKSIYILSLLFLFNSSYSKAQGITGTWEGDLNNDEFLQVNVVQVKNTLCGYTWDYVYGDRDNFCKAYFSGYYDERKQEWILTGTSFITSSGNHVLMRLRLKKNYEKGNVILEGYETDPRIPMGSLFSLMNRQTVYLKKVSSKPFQMLDNMRDCMKKPPLKKDSVALKGPDKRDRKPDPVKKPDTTRKPPVIVKKPPVIVKKPDTSIRKKVIPVKTVPIKRADSLKEIKTPVKPPARTKDSLLISQVMKRKNTEMSHLVVNVKEIRLEVFDNGIVDNDTVSVFYNGTLLLSHKKLSEKAIVIPITLDEKISTHEITLFAENLGSIPPNTALVVVHAGDKRYELYSSASLTENAVIRFEYKPK